jgi:DNA-binding response OmpR family regulator
VPSRQEIQGVLLYGHDAVLLMTRARILEGAGFRTSVTSELKEITHLARRFPADLIVLCHSLSDMECRTAALIAKHYRPWARTLLMVAEGGTEDDRAVSELADDVFFLSLEPEKFVEKVSSMLEERARSRMLRFPAKGWMPGGHLAQTS